MRLRTPRENRIHATASEKAVNILGADRSPNGRQPSKQTWPSHDMPAARGRRENPVRTFEIDLYQLGVTAHRDDKVDCVVDRRVRESACVRRDQVIQAVAPGPPGGSSVAFRDQTNGTDVDVPKSLLAAWNNHRTSFLLGHNEGIDCCRR